MTTASKRPHLFAALSEQNIKNCIICDKKTPNRVGSVIGTSLYYFRICKACTKEYFADCGNVFSQAVRIRTAILIVEKGSISLKDAFNIILNRFNLIEEDSKIAQQYMKRSLKTASKGYCRICNQLTDRKLTNKYSVYFICDECDEKYFSMYATPHVKISVLLDAVSLFRHEKIALPYAIDVENGLCTLDEARANIVRDKKEARISAPDIFVRGRRLPGSFESRK